MRVLGLTLTACVVLALSACSGDSTKKDKDGKGKDGKNGGSKSNAAKIVGTWEPADPKGAGMTLEFTSDGKLKMDAGPIKIEGTYKVDGDKLTTTMKAEGGKEKTETGKIKELTDTKLVTEDPKGKTDEFKRKK
jgi:uncharacterized protein (TIGR03066 family)